ncbi:unnamed protein product [Cyprideis torosa]|uniref:Uncharacterized protein n=1 Tax=Cyprideis torosa TaxID=163714 RepID=A0A7R8W2P2_9CRUS|nr:unnamed protein product [Cyprideis torosa]CAG0882140.1 unnamed protein product [Cyprideis torosa]
MTEYPPEVDMFSVPHSRMKYLVQGYVERVERTNFQDLAEFDQLLNDLMMTFLEFKRHEQIENSLIVRRLRSKLRSLSIFNDTVHHCHEDSQLKFMTELLEEGFYCLKKPVAERLRYGETLRSALKHFTETFIPHMEEEEEIFQPLLIKYFGYEELKLLQSTVLRWHFEASDAFSDPRTKPETEESDSSRAAEDIIPSELWLEVFKHLNSPRDMLRSVQVCKSWNETILSSSELWEEVALKDFIRRVDHQATGSPSSLDPIQVLPEYSLSGFVDSLLKRVGRSVRKLSFSGSEFGPFINSTLVRHALEWTPELRELDLSGCSNISAASFRCSSEASNQISLHLLNDVNLSGCRWIDDRAIETLVAAFRPGTTSLQSLNLSGCWLLSNASLGALRPFCADLRFLELSGVYQLTGPALSEFVHASCPRLSPLNLYYCDNVENGPYQQEANGCQNLGTKDCCRNWYED